MKKSFALFSLFLLPRLVLAQSEITMADTFRQEGKIYVVVAVLSVIFAGIVLFLVSLERRISKMEKQISANRGQ